MLCKKCGGEILEGETVCSNCGQSVSESEESRSSDSEKDIEQFSNTDSQNPKQFSDSEENIEPISNINNQSIEIDSENILENNASSEKNNIKNTIRGVLLGFVIIIIVGGVFMVLFNIYKNSPERIFEEVKESENFNKYITKKGYTVLGYYFIDLINNDGKKEIVFDVSDKSEGIERRMSYVGIKENGKYRIGMLGSIGGELVDTIEVFKSIDNTNSIFIHLKNVDEPSQESIDAIKTQYGIDNDKDAKEMIESMYKTGLEQYGLFDMTDYNFISYNEKNAEMNSMDFAIAFSPEKILAKANDPNTNKPVYQYLDVYEESLQEQQNSDEPKDYSISEDEFNKYIEDLKNGKEAVEYFSVLEDELNSENKEAASEEETQEIKEEISMELSEKENFSEKISE